MLARCARAQRTARDCGSPPSSRTPARRCDARHRLHAECEAALQQAFRYARVPARDVFGFHPLPLSSSNTPLHPSPSPAPLQSVADVATGSGRAAELRRTLEVARAEHAASLAAAAARDAAGTERVWKSSAASKQQLDEAQRSAVSEALERATEASAQLRRGGAHERGLRGPRRR